MPVWVGPGIDTDALLVVETVPDPEIPTQYASPRKRLSQLLPTAGFHDKNVAKVME